MISYKLKKNQSQLVIIDVQERLLPVIANNKSIVKHSKLLLRCAQVLSIPVKYTEQYPKGLGPTVSDISDLLPPKPPDLRRCTFPATMNLASLIFLETNEDKSYWRELKHTYAF